MEEKKTPIIHQVFVPLTSFYLSDAGFAPTQEGPATISGSWDIPDTDIKLIRLSKRVGLEKDSDKPVFAEDVVLDGTPFEIQIMSPGHNHMDFNAGLLFPFTQPDPSQLLIFPGSFENKVRNPILFLRLFCQGNIFAPYGFMKGVEVFHFHDFHQTTNEGYASLYAHDVDRFLQFYKKYSTLAHNLRETAKNNPKSVFESWFKRVNNAIYFFGQTYFTSERNHLNNDAKDKNNLRLIYLCTALDALIGSGNPSGKELAKKADLLLCNITAAVKKDVEDFYDERSRYIHANPNTMGGATPNKTIDKFSTYIQKLILMSLELSGDADFVNALTTSGQKHWFNFYEKLGLYAQYSIKKLTRKAFEEVSNFKDGYELAERRFIESKINIWSKEPS